MGGNSAGTGRSGQTAPTYQALGTTNNETKISAKFDLATMAGNNGEAVAVNGAKWIDGVISTLTKERNLLTTLQGLDSDTTQTAEEAAWQRVQDAIQFNLFGQNRTASGKVRRQLRRRQQHRYGGPGIGSGRD